MIRTFSLLRSHLSSISKTPSPRCHADCLTLSAVLARSLSHSSKQNKEDKPRDVVSLINRDPASPPQLFVVQPRLRPDTALHAKLNEALCLANSLEEQRDGLFDTDFFEKGMPPHIVVQNPAARSPKPRADTYFGPGTVDNIKCHLHAAEEKGEVDAVFVNAILSGIQQRNLERIWEKPVLDRVGLIIEIFNAHALTKEAKLQAELAALMYKKTRLVRVRGPDGRYAFGVGGEAEVVSARGRGSGARGFLSGAGETELQLQRRRILERRKILMLQIEEVRRTRAVQRAARKRHGDSFGGQGLPTVAVVGYTNAGKSTLVSALSDTDLYSDDRLFATVDPRLRSVFLPSGRKVLLSDTVGFISELPVQLVEAFHATLEEVVEADLLVHVLDSSAPNLDEHRSSVLQVLEQIGVSEEKLQNMVEVWNKIDLEEEDVTMSDCIDDAEVNNEADDFSGEEDLVCETSSHAEDDEGIDPQPQGLDDDVRNGHNEDDGYHQDDVTHKLSSGDADEAMGSEGEDYSDGWLLESEDRQFGEQTEGSSLAQNTFGAQRTGLSEDWKWGPHVKTSAVTGVGLQELLELIDEKLKKQDERLKSESGAGTGAFGRKWRPSCSDEAMAVEQ